MWLNTEQTRRIRKHRPRVRLGKPFAFNGSEENLGVPPRHIGVTLTLIGFKPEVTPTIQHLLGGSARDAELQPPPRNEIRRPDILRKTEGVWVPHVRDSGADLNATRLRPDRRE